jgi:hypothetical protein
MFPVTSEPFENSESVDEYSEIVFEGNEIFKGCLY